MIYPEAIQFLYGLQVFGANFGLENTRQLAALAGNRQNELRFIHVAGTNGKGSTCAMLESIYRAAGLRVGLFTSPHLVSFRERMQVNRVLISEGDVARLVAAGILPAVEPGLQPGGKGADATGRVKMSEAEAISSASPGGRMPPSTPGRMPAATTFFEFITVMALSYFAEQKCDLVIWETGLGGRLDATNIVTPLASVITNIGLDHQQWLGDTLADIASEKAGIIKPGIPVLTATTEPEALVVIERTAGELGSSLTCTTTHHASRITHHMPLLGDHQQSNAALAVATVEALRKQIPVSDEQIRDGLAQLNWPGRLQLVARPGGRKLLLDGAHNLAGVEALAMSLQKHFPNERPTLILGVLADKEWQPMSRRLAAVASRILTVPVNSNRTTTAAEVAAVCRQEQPLVTVECSSLSEALQRTTDDPLVLVTGSLYLVGEALELLRLGPAVDASERGLNEWGGMKSQAKER